MIVSIIEFDFYQAFRYNALLFIFSPFIFLCILDKFLVFLFAKKSFLLDKLNDKVWYFFLVVAILFGIVRNIPIFDYLIPTAV